MSDCFLLGAGFSKAISQHMPVLNELSALLRKRVDLPKEAVAIGDNVEHWMSYLSQPQPWISASGNLRHKAAFLELTREIGLVINERVHDAMDGKVPPWLSSLVQWWHVNQSHVITLNYDTLIERVCGEIEVGNDRIHMNNIYPMPMPDIRRSMVVASNPIATFSLYKLHGSVNWYYSGSESYFGETIYSGPVTRWGSSDDKNERDSLDAAADKVPLIIPPTTEKVSFFQHGTIRQIWAKAGQALLAPDRIFCIGYSLPETDLSIRFFLKQHKSANPKLVIVNTDQECIARYRDLLGDQYEVDDSYVVSGAVEKLAGDLGK